MVRSKKKILSYSERVGLEDQKREAEATLREAATPGTTHGGEINRAKLQGEIQHLDKEIHDGTAPRVGGVAKDRMAKRAKELESRISEGMPTREEMAHPGKNPGAVHKHLRWSERNKGSINEYKDLQRRLNPDAPINIESLRRNK